MRKIKLSAGVSALAIIIGGSAFAQDTGHFLDTFPAKLTGHLSGLPVHHHPDTELLWVKLPDGSVIGGYIFDKDGQDIGAAISGSEAITALDTLSALLPEGLTPASMAAGAAQSGFVPLAGGSAQSSQVNTSFLPPPPAGANPAEMADFIEQMRLYSDQALSGASEEQKAAWMADLITLIDTAETPTHLQLSVIEWAEKIQGQPILDDASRDQMSQIIRAEKGEIPTPVAAPSTAPAPAVGLAPIPDITPEATLGQAAAPVRELAGGEAPTAAIEPPALAPVAAPAPQVAPESSALAQPTGETSHTQAFFDAIQTQTAWVEIGDAAAPLVYMYADPLCPYCARAFANMENDINNGELRLRVILAPLVNSKSGDTIAGILTSENPSQALFDHEIKYARYGGSDLKPVDFGTLDPEEGAKIRRNFELAGEYGIPGVPFFAWQTADGPKMLSGVPASGQFKSTALKPE